MSLELKKQIQRFLGLLNYTSSYISDLAKKKKALQSLLCKNNPLELIKNTYKYFQTVKRRMLSTTMFRTP